MDNVIALERAILLARVLARYDIDWAHVIAEQIHKSALWRNTSMPFPILIHKLCMETEVRFSLQLDPHIEALHTLDPSLINADENLVALQ